VVALAALHRVLPPAWDGKVLAVILKVARVCLAIAVALVAVSFAVEQVRVGLYPVLEQRDRAVGDGQLTGQMQWGDHGFDQQGLLTLAAGPATLLDGNAMIANANGNAEPAKPAEVAQQTETNLPMKGAPASGGEAFGNFDRGGIADKLVDVTRSSSSGEGYAGRIAQKKQRLQQIDPTAVVQTGPGLPQWGFTTVRLKFTGPVKSDQRIELVLLGPSANLVLAFLRVLLVAFLVAASFGLPGRMWPRVLLSRFRGKGAVWSGTAALFLVLASALTSTSARAQAAPEPTAPSAQLLADLKARLLEPAACAPACATIARVALEAGADELVVRAEVHALAPTLVPLPGADKQWTASTLTVDGKAWSGATRDGSGLWVALPAGRHDVVLAGALPRRDSVQLAFPLLPHRAAFSSSAWTVDGIHEDGVPDANLQLSRRAKAEGAAKDASEPTVLPPFLLVERSLLLGLSFEVETRVTRLSPLGAPVVLEVPLLPGENVTTEGVRVEGKKVLVSLGPNDSELLWSGSIAPSSKLELVAEQGAPFLESWSLAASPVWHVEEQGIPPLHDEVPRGGGARAWRPWPGEKLALAITRPEGVPGQTITIERTSEDVKPGLRSTDVTLTLDLRASRGGEHPITLPHGAELLSATINGAAQPLRPSGDKVTVPIVPGKQQVVLAVRVPEGISLRYQAPRFDVGQPSVNAEIKIDVPADRWVLFAAGPRSGPAVLFWSFIVVVLLAGFALSRVPFSPLQIHHWILLGLGLTQVPVAVAALVAGWLLALGWRKQPPASDKMHPLVFNLAQIVLVGWTVTALGCLLFS
ncbi:MAG TPA: hypothetical protein VGO62_03805, partial [Myxococcota bacterium]